MFQLLLNVLYILNSSDDQKTRLRIFTMSYFVFHYLSCSVPTHLDTRLLTSIEIRFLTRLLVFQSLAFITCARILWNISNCMHNQISSPWLQVQHAHSPKCQYILVSSLDALAMLAPIAYYFVALVLHLNKFLCPVLALREQFLQLPFELLS